jgi:hypothetical protein
LITRRRGPGGRDVRDRDIDQQGIAARFGTSWQRLAAINGQHAGMTIVLIHPGERIWLS